MRDYQELLKFRGAEAALGWSLGGVIRRSQVAKPYSDVNVPYWLRVISLCEDNQNLNNETCSEEKIKTDAIFFNVPEMIRVGVERSGAPLKLRYTSSEQRLVMTSIFDHLEPPQPYNAKIEKKRIRLFKEAKSLYEAFESSLIQGNHSTREPAYTNLTGSCGFYLCYACEPVSNELRECLPPGVWHMLNFLSEIGVRDKNLVNADNRSLKLILKNNKWLLDSKIRSKVFNFLPEKQLFNLARVIPKLIADIDITTHTLTRKDVLQRKVDLFDHQKDSLMLLRNVSRKGRLKTKYLNHIQGYEQQQMKSSVKSNLHNRKPKLIVNAGEQHLNSSLDCSSFLQVKLYVIDNFDTKDVIGTGSSFFLNSDRSAFYKLKVMLEDQEYSSRSIEDAIDEHCVEEQPFALYVNRTRTACHIGFTYVNREKNLKNNIIEENDGKLTSIQPSMRLFDYCILANREHPHQNNSRSIYDKSKKFVLSNMGYESKDVRFSVTRRVEDTPLKKQHELEDVIMSHQKNAAFWALGGGGLFCDEPGLGKSATLLAHLSKYSIIRKHWLFYASHGRVANYLPATINPRGLMMVINDKEDGGPVYWSFAARGYKGMDSFYIEIDNSKKIKMNNPKTTYDEVKKERLEDLDEASLVKKKTVKYVDEATKENDNHNDDCSSRILKIVEFDSMSPASIAENRLPPGVLMFLKQIELGTVYYQDKNLNDVIERGQRAITHAEREVKRGPDATWKAFAAERQIRIDLLNEAKRHLRQSVSAVEEMTARSCTYLTDVYHSDAVSQRPAFKIHTLHEKKVHEKVESTAVQFDNLSVIMHHNQEFNNIDIDESNDIHRNEIENPQQNHSYLKEDLNSFNDKSTVVKQRELKRESSCSDSEFIDSQCSEHADENESLILSRSGSPCSSKEQILNEKKGLTDVLDTLMQVTGPDYGMNRLPTKMTDLCYGSRISEGSLLIVPNELMSHWVTQIQLWLGGRWSISLLNPDGKNNFKGIVSKQETGFTDVVIINNWTETLLSKKKSSIKPKDVKIQSFREYLRLKKVFMKLTRAKLVLTSFTGLNDWIWGPNLSNSSNKRRKGNIFKYDSALKHNLQNLLQSHFEPLFKDRDNDDFNQFASYPKEDVIDIDSLEYFISLSNVFEPEYYKYWADHNQFLKFSSPLSSIHWNQIFVDEGHKLAFGKTMTSTNFGFLRYNNSWIVSGTPLWRMKQDQEGWKDIHKLFKLCDFPYSNIRFVSGDTKTKSDNSTMILYSESENLNAMNLILKKFWENKTALHLLLLRNSMLERFVCHNKMRLELLPPPFVVNVALKPSLLEESFYEDVLGMQMKNIIANRFSLTQHKSCLLHTDASTEAKSALFNLKYIPLMSFNWSSYSYNQVEDTIAMLIIANDKNSFNRKKIFNSGRVQKPVFNHKPKIFKLEQIARISQMFDYLNMVARYAVECDKCKFQTRNPLTVPCKELHVICPYCDYVQRLTKKDKSFNETNAGSSEKSYTPLKRERHLDEPNNQTPCNFLIPEQRTSYDTDESLIFENIFTKRNNDVKMSRDDDIDVDVISSTKNRHDKFLSSWLNNVNDINKCPVCFDEIHGEFYDHIQPFRQERPAIESKMKLKVNDTANQVKLVYEERLQNLVEKIEQVKNYVNDNNVDDIIENKNKCNVTALFPNQRSNSDNIANNFQNNQNFPIINLHDEVVWSDYIENKELQEFQIWESIWKIVKAQKKLWHMRYDDETHCKVLSRNIMFTNNKDPPLSEINTNMLKASDLLFEEQGTSHLFDPQTISWARLPSGCNGLSENELHKFLYNSNLANPLDIANTIENGEKRPAENCKSPFLPLSNQIEKERKLEFSLFQNISLIRYLVNKVILLIIKQGTMLEIPITSNRKSFINKQAMWYDAYKRRNRMLHLWQNNKSQSEIIKKNNMGVPSQNSNFLTKPCVKIMIVSDENSLLALVRECLIRNGVRCCSYFADSLNKKTGQIHNYMTDSETNVLLLGKKKGAVGLDLSCVSIIFLLDTFQNIDEDQQIIARAHRIGAKGPVYTERLIVNGFSDEQKAFVRPLWGGGSLSENLEEEKSNLLFNYLKMRAANEEEKTVENNIYYSADMYRNLMKIKTMRDGPEKKKKKVPSFEALQRYLVFRRIIHSQLEKRIEKKISG